MKKNHLLSIMLCSLLFTVSCRRDVSRAGDSPHSGTVPAQASSAIKTEIVSATVAKSILTLNGQVSSTENGKADITSPINGVITTRLVKVGDLVAKNQPVAILNSIYGQTDLQVLQKLEQDKTALSQAEDNANQAQAELVNSSIDLRRKRTLFEAGVMAKSDVNDAEERFTKAKSIARDTATLATLARTTLYRDQAIYQQAELSGSRLTRNLTPVEINPNKTFTPRAAAGSIAFYVRAPMAGTITNVNMAAGQSISPGTVLATVMNLNEVYVDANAHESDFPYLHLGVPVTVSAPAYSKEIFPGKISYIGKQLDPGTRTITVRSLIHNPKETLRPGMFVSATLSSNENKRSITIPDSAVLILADKHYVFIEIGNGKSASPRYEKKEVQIGKSAEGKTEITSGLSPGTRVVTEGNLLLEGQE